MTPTSALAVVQGEPIIGIVFLRPGHIQAEFTIGTLDAVLRTDPDLTPPFILVAPSITTRGHHSYPFTVTVVSSLKP